MKMIHLTFYVPNGLGFDKRYRFPLVTNPQNIIAVGDTYKNYSGPCFTEITMAEDFSKAFQHLMMDTREFYECGRKTQRKQVLPFLELQKRLLKNGMSAWVMKRRKRNALDLSRHLHKA